VAHATPHTTLMAPINQLGRPMMVVRQYVSSPQKLLAASAESLIPGAASVAGAVAPRASTNRFFFRSPFAYIETVPVSLLFCW